MKKIVYCFWKDFLKEKLKHSDTPDNFDEFLKVSLNTIYSSISYALKNGFNIEIITDLECMKYFEHLSVDKLSSELEFVTYTENSWIEGKMYSISKQKEPFIYIDWNIILSDELLFKKIKTCNKDFIVAFEYKIQIDDGYQNLNEVEYGKLRTFSWLMDMSNHYIESFVQNHKTALDCRILGFNNLKVRDDYINNFFKCLDITKDSKYLFDSYLIIEEYLLYCITKSSNVSYSELFTNKNKLKDKLSNVHSPVQLASYREILQSKIFQNGFCDKNTLITNINKKQKKCTISLCTVVMNRKDHILQTLKYNIRIVRKFKGVVDINLIDYNSKDGLKEYLFKEKWFLKALEDGILKYYWNNDASFYHRTLPKNIIHFLSKGEYLFNIDADNYITESYLTFCILEIKASNNIYFRPSHSSHEGSFGRIGINRKDFKEIGGYNLKIKNYGFEDTEITLRLRKRGVKQVLIPSHLVQKVINHDDELRFANEKLAFDEISKFESDRKNREIDIEPFPNKNRKIDIELFEINSNQIETRINDTYPYI